MSFCRILLNNINYKCIFCIFRYRWATRLGVNKMQFQFQFSHNYCIFANNTIKNDSRP